MHSRNGHKRAVLYARVSTDEQAEKGYSLPSQVEACRKYAESIGYAIIGEPFQENFTGTIPIEQRPEGQKAYAMLASGEADALIVYTMDRLVRPPDDGDEWDTPILIRSLAKLGREIHTVNRGKLGTSFAELLIAMLDAKSAGDERRRLLERTSRGRATKAKNGQVVGNCIYPYGYCKTGEGRTAGIEVNEAEAQIVGQIFQWYVYGDGECRPMSLAAIAKRLTGREIDTPGATRAHRKLKTRPPHAWDFGTVGYILQNPIYIGQWRWGKLGACIPVPALVSRALWDEAQKRREYNKQLSRHNKSRMYLLSGMIKCHCGRAMVGTSSPVAGNDRAYYQCTEVKRKYKGIEAICDQRQVRADRTEAVVWEYVLDLLTNPETFEDELRRAQAAELDAIQPKRERLQIVTGLIVEAEAEAGKLAGALVKASGVVGDALQRQIDEVNQKHAKLTRERDRLQVEIEAGALTDDQIDQAMNYRRDVIEGLKHATPEDKRAMFELLQVEILVKGYAVTVHCRVPMGAEPREINLDRLGEFLSYSSRSRWIVLQSEPFDLASELFTVAQAPATVPT